MPAWRRTLPMHVPALRWKWVAVSGPSMAPTLRHGDTVVVRRGATIAAGDVVIARFRSMPDRLIVKRATRAQEGGWWLVSDNAFAAGDSTAHGVADVEGRAVVRLRAGRPRLLRRVAPPIGDPDVQDSGRRATPGQAGS